MDARALDPGFGGLEQGGLLAELAFVRRLARSLLVDENDAEDVVQETWLRARVGPDPAAIGPAGLRSWLAAVTRRLARDAGRAGRRRVERERRGARPEALPSTLDGLERSAELERLVHAVHGLAEPYRAVVLWRYLDGRSGADIARAQGISEAVVRKRLARARAELRAALARELGGDPRGALLAILGADPATLGVPGGAGLSVGGSAGLAPGAKLALLGSAGLAVAAGVTLEVALRVPSPVATDEPLAPSLAAPSEPRVEAGAATDAATDAHAQPGPAGAAFARPEDVDVDLPRAASASSTSRAPRTRTQDVLMLQVGREGEEQQILELETKTVDGP